MDFEEREDRYELIKQIGEKIQGKLEDLFLPGDIDDDERYSD